MLTENTRTLMHPPAIKHEHELADALEKAKKMDGFKGLARRTGGTLGYKFAAA